MQGSWMIRAFPVGSELLGGVGAGDGVQSRPRGFQRLQLWLNGLRKPTWMFIITHLGEPRQIIQKYL